MYRYRAVLGHVNDSSKFRHGSKSGTIVENFNSRLKPYIDPRKTITQKTLGLYQFILNHRPFQRSHHPYLVGKTPAEALTGKPHRHWLELLGYYRFKRPLLTA